MKDNLESDLKVISNWMTLNRLTLSPEKSMFMIVGHPKHLLNTHDLTISLQGKTIQRVTSMKVLGINIDDKLKWTTHVNVISKKCNHILNTIYPLRDFLSHRSKTILINAYIMSVLTYVSSVWLNPSKHNYKNIDKIIKRSARFIYRKRYIDNVDNEISNLKWLKTNYKYKFEVLKFAYKIVNCIAPTYYLEYLNFNEFSTRETRQNSHTYANSQSSSSKMFMNNATKLWLDLPDTLKEKTLSFKSFKKNVKLYLLKCQKSDLISIENNSFPLNYSGIENVVLKYCKNNT